MGYVKSLSFSRTLQWVGVAKAKLGVAKAKHRQVLGRLPFSSPGERDRKVGRLQRSLGAKTLGARALAKTLGARTKAKAKGNSVALRNRKCGSAVCQRKSKRIRSSTR